jgi:sugar (pentulose or hexulose) kinase
MGNYLLGIDYGTGGAKVAIVDAADGSVPAYAFEEYPILTPKAGWTEHDAGLYWEVACRLVRNAVSEATSKTGMGIRDIKGVAVSSALPSLVLVDRDGHPLANAYNLMDRRATVEVQELKDSIGEDLIFELSKNRLDDHPAIVNLLWEKRNRPDLFKKLKKALTIDGFITMKLTGVASCHYSGAAFYGVAYDLLNRKFDRPLLDRLGLDLDLFPDLYPCDAIVGEITAAAAAETGLAPGTPVAAGQVDCNAGWVGAGAIEDGDIQMNLGTCGNFGIIHTRPVFHKSMIAFNYTTDSEKVFITVPTTTTGGQLIRYMRDNFFKAELEAEKKGGPNVYGLIDAEAEKVPAVADGLVVLPFLMGERTPIWDVDARGTIFGLSLNHTRGHVVRAMMESVAYALYDSFSIIRETGQKINAPIVLNEGGAKSGLWRRIITDVFNVPTVLVERRTGAPYGDAILVGVATGILPDFSIAKKWTRYIDQMEPDPANHALYMEYFALYKQIYEHLKGDFKTLAALRNKRS